MKKAPVISLIFVFILPFLVGFSSLTTPFALIDDAQTIKVSQELKKGGFSFLLSIDKEEGRVRPIYWLSSYIPYIVSGANPVSFHFYHLLLYSLASSLIFLIIYTLSKTNIAGIIGSLGYLFTTSPSEVWNRLGPQEPFIVVFLLISLYGIVRLYYYKKGLLLTLLISIISLFLATFTKETTLAVIPPLILLTILSVLVFRKFTIFTQCLTLITLFEIAFGLLLFSLRQAVSATTGYASQLTFDQPFLLRSLKSYLDLIFRDTGWLLTSAVLFFIIILIRKSKDLRHDTAMFKVFSIFFLALSASLLAVQLPWNYVLGRYLPPVFMALYIFIGCSLSYFFSIIRRLKKTTLGRVKVLGHLLGITFAIYALVFFYFQIKEVAKEISSSKEKIILHSDMVKNLNQNISDSTKVYFIISEGSFEYAYETGLHLNLFYGKKNAPERLNPNLLPPFKNGDLIVVSRQYQEIPDNIIAQILSRKTLLYHTYLWTIYRIER